jgi:hypothetical protein
MEVSFMTTQLISRDFHGARIRQRSNDGYLDATAMCQATGKRFGDYRRLKSTKEYFIAFSSDVGIPTSKIIQVNKGVQQGKTSQDQGTWIHPYASIHLAIWCSPDFAVMVTKWTFELLTKGSVTLNPVRAKPEELAAYTKINADMLDDFGITGEAKQTALNNGLKRKFGYDALEIWDLESPVPEAPKVLLIPTDIAKRVGLKNAKLVNLKLTELGLQTKHRDKRLYYKLTEEGLKHAQYQDTGKPQKSGELARAIRWHESVLTLF